MDQSVESSNGITEPVLVEPLPTLAKTTQPFSGPQMLVLRGVGDGKSITKAALFAGVHRTTVHLWRQENPDFEAAFQEWKRQAKDNLRSGVVCLGDRALEVVDEKLRAGDVKTALVVLKSLGALDREQIAPTTAEEIADERMLEAEQKKVRRDERRQKLLDRHLKNAAARSDMQNSVAKALANPTSPHHALPAPNPAQSAEDEEPDDLDDIESEESSQFTEEQLEQLKEILWEQKQQEKPEDPQPPPDDTKPAVE